MRKRKRERGREIMWIWEIRRIVVRTTPFNRIIIKCKQKRAQNGSAQVLLIFGCLFSFKSSSLFLSRSLTLCYISFNFFFCYSFNICPNESSCSLYAVEIVQTSIRLRLVWSYTNEPYKYAAKMKQTFKFSVIFFRALSPFPFSNGLSFQMKTKPENIKNELTMRRTL